MIGANGSHSMLQHINGMAAPTRSPAGAAPSARAPSPHTHTRARARALTLIL